MSPRSPGDGVDPRTRRRLIDAAFAVALLAALAWSYRAGVPPVPLAGVVVASFGLEFAISGGVGDRLRASERGGAAPELADTVESVATEMGIAPPPIVDADRDVGVNVLRDTEDSVLLLSGSLFDDLDDAAARGVVAHELAHVKLGHLRRAAARDAVTHVAGLAVCWAVVLNGQWSVVALLGGVGFVAAGVFRSNPVNRVFYTVASLGAVLPFLALAAKASRLEECEADDLAVAHTSAGDFCTGLYHVSTSARDGAPDDAVAGSVPFAHERTLTERLTAAHPSLEHRLARHGVALEDVRDANEPPVESIGR